MSAPNVYRSGSFNRANFEACQPVLFDFALVCVNANSPFESPAVDKLDKTDWQNPPTDFEESYLYSISMCGS